jgi:hypothetical protein
MFTIGASFRRGQGPVYLCRHYICFTVVSADYIRAVTVSRSVLALCTLCRYAILCNIYRDASLYSRLCLNLFSCSETSVTQLIGRRHVCRRRFVYPLPRKCVYRPLSRNGRFLLAPLFGISGVISQCYGYHHEVGIISLRLIQT